MLKDEITLGILLVMTSSNLLGFASMGQLMATAVVFCGSRLVLLTMIQRSSLSIFVTVLNN